MNARALAVHGLWRCCAAPSARRFQAAMRNPEATQRDLLDGMIRRNAATEFGRAHGFSKLQSTEDFQRAVPPRTYEEFRPWIDASATGKPDVLTPGRPLAFLPTSGTHTGAKLIPWTIALKREFHAALGPWVHGFMRSHPDAWRGSVYWSLSPPVWPDQRTSGGIPIGFASDTAYLPPLLRVLSESVFAVPASVAECPEPEAWKYATLLHLLASGDLSMVSVWSPTFLTSLLDPLTGWWPSLLKDLEHGTCTPPAGHDPVITRMERPRRNTRRVMALRELARSGDVPAPDRIWPDLAAISCWTDASARTPSQRLTGLFPNAKVVGKGLIATEGVVSIPWPEAAAPALALTSHFFEFANDAGNVHPAWDLHADECYSVLLTTGGGLYRYRLQDRVRVAGFHELCPLLEFVGRDGVTCDLCGEKLTESFVRNCLDRVSREHGQVWPFALLAPSGKPCPLGYTLYMTNVTPADTATLAAAVDTALCANVYYDHARRIGQLAPLEVVTVAGTADRAWARFQAIQAQRGQRLGDIKPTVLVSLPGWDLVFETGGKSANLS